MPIMSELTNSYISPEKSVFLNTTFKVLDDQNTEKNISDISMNLNEANSSTPKVQFNIGDSANHPVATVTPIESEVDSGFISSEAVIVTELSKGLIDVPSNVKFVDDDDFEDVSRYFYRYYILDECG